MMWVTRRAGVSLVLVWVVVSIVFFATHMVPGDPVLLLLAESGGSTDPELVERMRRDLGLDQPLLTQYFHHMTGLLRGDLGASMRDGSSITLAISLRLPRTLELVFAAGLFSLVFGVPLGIYAAVWQGGTADRILSTIAGGAMAVPVFVLGTVLIKIFAQTLKLAPAGGYVEFMVAPQQHMIQLAMPAVSLGLGLAATVFRMTRSSVIEVLNQGYIRAARAKGLSLGQLLVRHVVRNASTPVLTVLMLSLGALLGGSVLVEYVFNWPGLSGLLVGAVNARDHTTVVGVVTVVSILFVLMNMCLEIAYGIIDPRVRRK